MVSQGAASLCSFFLGARERANAQVSGDGRVWACVHSPIIKPPICVVLYSL